MDFICVHNFGAENGENGEELRTIDSEDGELRHGDAWHSLDFIHFVAY